MKIIIRNYFWFISILLIVSCATFSKLGFRDSKLIPMEAFFRNSDKDTFKISPDGKHISYLSPWHNRMNIFVINIDTNKTKRITESRESDIYYYFWKGSGKIVYLQDKGGDENDNLYISDIDKTGAKNLTPFEKVMVRIIDSLEDNDYEMLISMNKRDSRVFDAFRINLITGKINEIAKNNGKIMVWLSDHIGNLRVAIETDGLDRNILYRENESDDFNVIVQTSFKDTFFPLLFTYDNKNIYVASNVGRDKIAVYEYDPRKRKKIKLIYEHPEVDVHHLLSSKKRKLITGVSFITYKRDYYFFDIEGAEIQKYLEAKIPGKEVNIVSWNKNEDKLIARTYNDRTLGAFYYYDLNSKEFYKLAEVSPWLKEELLSEQKPISYKARDNITINGYLTLPRGIEAKNIPVIVNPHGGPWARDSWGYNSQVQFLASRGWAVFQMNFRGSSGYGKAFMEKGYKQWGRLMQDDITDGVMWLIDQGLADPTKIAIYGASYGGYAALAGLAFKPELYACGISYVGVSNLFSFLDSIPSYWEPMRKQVYERIGHPEKDKELLRAASPLFHVDKIKAPLFVAQGANDPRVKKSESDQIVEALRAKGVKVEYMLKENEGHGFSNEENRFDFYRSMEQFLNDCFTKETGSSTCLSQKLGTN